MKKLFIFICWSAVSVTYAQFVAQPLNYPGMGYWPYYFSIADPEHVWIGTIHESGIPYSMAVHTDNGGESWIFDSIPVPGIPFITSTASLDSNTCFYVFSDFNVGGGSIWKTDDAGDNWSCLTTTQFDGGFANFYHPFTADTGVAVGDPVDGYFEIQLTCDGGNTWERLPAVNIPEPIDGEYALTNCYCTYGNSIWFSTTKGRCFRSVDRGRHWDATRVVTTVSQSFNVCFSSLLTGAFWSMESNNGDIAITSDGGVSWDTLAFMPGHIILHMSNVEGFEEGFVVSTWKNSTNVYFTANMFESYQVLGHNMISTGALDFIDETTGWLSGGETGSYEIYKFMGVLTKTRSIAATGELIQIHPNPASIYSDVIIPPKLISNNSELNIRGITGQLIEGIPLINGDIRRLRLDADKYENGLYLIQIISDNAPVFSRKWIVAH